MPQPVLIPGAALTQVQDLMFGLVEPHEVHMGLILQLAQVYQSAVIHTRPWERRLRSHQPTAVQFLELQ